EKVEGKTLGEMPRSSEDVPPAVVPLLQGGGQPPVQGMVPVAPSPGGSVPAGPARPDAKKMPSTEPVPPPQGGSGGFGIGGGFGGQSITSAMSRRSQSTAPEGPADKSASASQRDARTYLADAETEESERLKRIKQHVGEHGRSRVPALERGKGDPTGRPLGDG